MNCEMIGVDKVWQHPLDQVFLLFRVLFGTFPDLHIIINRTQIFMRLGVENLKTRK